MKKSDGDDRFSLKPGRWYAAEFIGDEFGERLRHYSPIQVLNVKPLKSGSRRFELEFFHANYPAGVQGKLYTLEMLERARRYVLARSVEHKPARILLIHEISWAWMVLHGFAVRADETDIQTGLTRLYS